MKRCQFGLRLLLLLVALLATCFAWLGAVRSKLCSEREVARMQLEHSLAAHERWHAMFAAHLQQLQAKPRSTGQALGMRRDITQLEKTEAKIAAMRKELDSMK